MGGPSLFHFLARGRGRVNIPQCDASFCFVSFGSFHSVSSLFLPYQSSHVEKLHVLYIHIIFCLPLLAPFFFQRQMEKLMTDLAVSPGEGEGREGQQHPATDKPPRPGGFTAGAEGVVRAGSPAATAASTATLSKGSSGVAEDGGGGGGGAVGGAGGGVGGGGGGTFSGAKR